MPPRNDPQTGAEIPAASIPPVMVAVGSPEFDQIIKAAVDGALARVQEAPPVVRQVAVQTPAVIPQTSIDTSEPGLDDLTVRFHRFCVFQNCGYQRGQEAGFPRAAALSLAATGNAHITHDPRRGRAAA